LTQVKSKTQTPAEKQLELEKAMDEYSKTQQQLDKINNQL